MTLSNLFYLFIVVLVAYALWNHLNVSRTARMFAKKHCESLGVQFLDQNIILRKLSLHRSPHSVFAIGRSYTFEFSSIGDRRYPGEIFLIGNRLKTIELAPYKAVIDKNHDIN